ncbi:MULTISPECIES: hypothetical protein [Comamonas]|nr:MULTISPECIES: hypothetical protein [Comamonas]MPT12506.1 hypothetical protein [Comamonas sp.]
MSDDSELYFLEHENRPTRTELESNSSPYLLSEWHLPIVWVALFQPWDARIDATSIRDRDRAYFAAKRYDAITNLEKRRPWIRTAAPGLDEVWLDSFTEFLMACELSWVHVQPPPLFEEGSAPSINDLRQLLAIFDIPQSSLDATTKDVADDQDLYRTCFASQFNSTEVDIKLFSLGASGTDNLMKWETQ